MEKVIKKNNKHNFGGAKKVLESVSENAFDQGWIKVYGAKEHNLKNIDVQIPKGKLTIITGPSGSGKSSLALDILFTEGKRRYMESLSSYARQFLGISKKPDFDKIDGLCPAIAIEQKTVSSNPRSTVGTITEIYDYMRVLYSRVGTVHCPECNLEIKSESPEAITNGLLDSFIGQSVVIAAPIAREKKGEFEKEILDLFSKGYYRFVIDGVKQKFSFINDIKNLKLKKTYKHNIDLLIDSIEVDSHEKSRLQEAVEKAFTITGGSCKVIVESKPDCVSDISDDKNISGEIINKEYIYSSARMCVKCMKSIPELEPRCFSFNSPVGACDGCSGLGFVHEWPWQKGDEEFWKTKYPDFFGPKYAQEKTCVKCFGKRLNKNVLAVTISDDGGEKNIYDVCDLSIRDMVIFFENLQLDNSSKAVASSLIKEISNRLNFLNEVGLSYLTLNRPAGTLSGGEGQRIRLATQIGSALSGVLYILDEPSIGLHQRDNDRLIKTLKYLRDQGNTVVVVEHDIDTMHQADYIIDMGPQAGVLGGQVTAVGNPVQVAANINSMTGAYLSGEKNIIRKHEIRKPMGFLELENLSKNNLQDVSVKFPLGVFCGVSGVSGSGKSTLVMQELVPAVSMELSGKSFKGKKYLSNYNLNDQGLTGAEYIENMVVIDQSPIGRTPRSNPATYLGIFDDMRKLFASLPESNARGYKVGRFSFNVKEGRCFECEGDGVIKVAMHFLPEVTMECKSCFGKRYNSQTLEIKYKNKNIAEILDMTAYEAREFFAAHASIVKRLDLLCDVGLDYLKLGQASTTLSGGEAQRIKLVDELAKRGRNTLYVLDEPTTGLHNSDIDRLLDVLNKLVDKGNSMIVIEHNLDVLKTVDYLIDLGPDGGDKGGVIVACGTPEYIATCKNSYTGQYLNKVMSK
ncbi:MAG: Excinuclease ABC, subunit A [candidate division TM6 bacterium GW2011_GWF2_30_66]|nr:MAG: Excinuclease ABC, subunit A [candidate division TM6 bacterium GW2011_GWF2_30_66]